jgi:hypothetical protein
MLYKKRQLIDPDSKMWEHINMLAPRCNVQQIPRSPDDNVPTIQKFKETTKVSTRIFLCVLENGTSAVQDADSSSVSNAGGQEARYKLLRHEM